jgi:predicted Zn-dependent protease
MHLVPDFVVPVTRPGVSLPREEAAPVGCSAVVTQHLDLHSEYLRADLFLAMGQPVEAARVLEPLVASEPGNVAALELLARSYFGAAQLQKAEDALRRLVELAPADGWARRALARTLERQSRPAEAGAHHRVADALGAA